MTDMTKTIQQEIVQQTEIYTKYMETAAEKAIERIVDYSKRAIESIDNTEDRSKKQTSSSVSDSDNSAPAAAKLNQEFSSEAIKEG